MTILQKKYWIISANLALLLVSGCAAPIKIDYYTAPPDLGPQNSGQMIGYTTPPFGLAHAVERTYIEYVDSELVPTDNDDRVLIVPGVHAIAVTTCLGRSDCVIIGHAIFEMNIQPGKTYIVKTTRPRPSGFLGMKSEVWLEDENGNKLTDVVNVNLENPDSNQIMPLLIPVRP